MSGDVVRSPDVASRDRRWRWVVGLLIAGWASFAVYDLVHAPVNPFEAGVYLNGGKRVLAGERVYRDFFSIYGAGLYYPFALSQRIFTPPHVAAGVVFFGFALANVVLTSAVASRTVQNRAFAMIPLLASFAGYGGGLRLTFALLAILALYRYVSSGRTVWAAAAGALVAVNLAVQQDMAAYGGAAVGITVTCVAFVRGRERGAAWATAARDAFAVCFGWIAVASVWLALMQLSSGAGLYIRHAFAIPLRHYDTLHMGDIPPIWAAPPLDPSVVSMWARLGMDGFVRWFIYTFPFYWVPGACLVTAVWAGVRLIRGVRAPSDFAWVAGMLAISSFGLFMSRTILRTGDSIKLVVNALPAIIVLSGWVAHWWTTGADNVAYRFRGRSVRSIAALTVGSALTLYVVYPQIQGVIKPLVRGDRQMSVSDDVRAAGNADLARVTTFLTREPNRTSLFCVPDAPILYLTTGIPNATSYDYLDPIIDPVVSATLVKQLQERRPSHVVVHEGVRFWGQYELGYEYGREVLAHIDSNYREVFRSDKYRVLRRKDLVVDSLGGGDPAR